MINIPEYQKDPHTSASSITQLEQRLKELRSEFESSQKALADLEQRAANHRNSLLRISGAIQVLEEELAKEGGIAEVHEPEQETEP